MSWDLLDPDGRPSAEPWSETERLALVFFSLSVVASLALLTHPWNELVLDASTYVVVSKSLVAGAGYRYLEIPFDLRPPGFSLLIAPIVATWGVDFAALNLFTSAIGAIGVVLLFAYLRDSLGWRLALLVVIAIWLNPMFRSLCNQPMSDIPSLTLVIACLWVERSSGQSSGWKREVLLGCLLGLSILMRSANWLLVAAIGLSRLFRRLRSAQPEPGWKAWALAKLVLPTALALLVVLPWSLYRDSHRAPEVDDQVGIQSYATAMFHSDWGDPNSPWIGLAEIVTRAALRSDQIATVLGSRLSVDRFGNQRADRTATASEIAGSLALIAALLLALWLRSEPIEILCLATLSVTLVYFGFRSRLIFPVFVLALPCALWVIREFARRHGGHRRGNFLCVALVMAMIVGDFDPRPHWPEVEARHVEWTETCAGLEAVLPPDARIATRVGTHLAACLDQPIFSLEFAMPRLGAERGLDEVIAKYRVNTLAIEANSALARAIAVRLGAGTPVKSLVVWRLQEKFRSARRRRDQLTP